jgi:hypothetical protein
VDRLVHARWACRPGDGRCTILGTEGNIELLQVRRHRRPRRLPYSQRLIADLFERTETAMSQPQRFKVCELALAAQAKAGRLA